MHCLQQHSQHQPARRAPTARRAPPLLQGDLLRPLGLPALLVGDAALGGISTTLTAYESLLLRGAAPLAVVMADDGRLRNVEAVRHHLQHAVVHRCAGRHARACRRPVLAGRRASFPSLLSLMVHPLC